MNQPRQVRLADRPEDFKRLGITEKIEPFEDGMRTDPSRPGHYEWWYFDAHLADGAKLFVTFFTKDAATPNTGLKPIITIDIDRPDGSAINKRAELGASDFYASTDGCDVRIASNTFAGDLHRYRIQASIEEIAIDVELTGETPPWRPATGAMVFGEDEAKKFAWLASVPHGAVAATYRVGEEEHRTSGHGYHDHNWGDVALPSVLNN